jgi:uncharacterized protein YfaS (alpha-2-macroglobulin family)
VALDGAFRKHGRVQLPAGFVARDLHVVLARGDVARALDGLGSLVDYPYGCVEQTMSRFLPALIVRDATRRTPLDLPPEVAAKLPDVLARGLARLYHFQHPDGGWGWWEHDATDNRMTIYVVYGLARCRSSGTQIDRTVLARGCAYLQTPLRNGKLDESLAARAWLALALAGQADRAELRAAARSALDDGHTPEARCRLALACRTANLGEPGERLWALVRDWQPTATEEVALHLSAQIVFGAPLERCHRSAGRLMASRTGLHWESTQATAGALDALAGLLGHVRSDTTAKGVKVHLGGEVVLDLSKPAELEKLVYRAHAPAEHHSAGEAAEIEMLADCDSRIYYTIAATGVQRLDKVEPIGSAIRVRRQLETLDGKPLDGQLHVGQVIAVRLQIDLEKAQEYILAEDRRPAGCEFADERLAGDKKNSPANVEFRDDRVCIFYPLLAAGHHELIYYLRAETAGAYRVLPGCVYPMYADKIRGETGAARVDVVEAERR